MPSDPAPSGVRLLCPVRSCGRELGQGERKFVCSEGHSFDVARSGYLNLLLASDRRSKTPGDSKEAALARRRVLESGIEDGVVNALRAVVPDGALVLDIGCGEGFHLRVLEVRGAGVDISAPAIDLAARREQARCWVVANADRTLPFADAQFDAILSITSRRNAQEFARVLAPGGIAVVVVPGARDLNELREAVLGRAEEKERSASVERELAERFALDRRIDIEYRTPCSADVVRDLLAATYRGGRTSQSERVAALGDMELTIHREVLVYRTQNRSR